MSVVQAAILEIVPLGRLGKFGVKMMLSLISPDYFVPIHGESRFKRSGRRLLALPIVMEI